MSVELMSLAFAALLGLLYVSVQSLLYKAQVGNAATVGSRDDIPPADRLAGRAERALRNFLETFPLFVAMVLVIELGPGSDIWTQVGAGLYVVMRALYLPLYLWGVAWIRTFSWNLATLGIALMMVGVLL